MHAHVQNLLLQATPPRTIVCDHMHPQ